MPKRRVEPARVCRAKHCAFQPLDSEWLCPKCKADIKSFYVEEDAEGADDSCCALHTGAYVICTECGYAASGDEVSRDLQKKLEVCVCPTCKGTGVVPEKGK